MQQDQKTVAYVLAGSILLALVFARIGALVDIVGDVSAALAALPGDLLAHPIRPMEGTTPLLYGIFGFIVPMGAYAFALSNGTSARPGTEHGSGRRGTVREGIVYKDRDNPENNILLTKHLGIAVRPNSSAKESLPNRNILIVGGSGAGKTAGFVEPNIMQIGAQRDLVVVDPKGTALGRTGMLWVEAGGDLRVFDTKNMDQSDVWGMLSEIKTHADVGSFVECLVSNTNNGRESSDPIWDNGERLFYSALLTWMLDWAPREDMNVRTFIALTTKADINEEGENAGPSPLDLLFEQIETGKRKTRASEPARKGGVRQARTRVAYKVEDTRYTRNRDHRSPAEWRARGEGSAQGMDPSEDLSLELWHQFRHGAGKTLKSFVISAHTRLSFLNDDRVKELLSGKDEIQLAQLGQVKDNRGRPRPPRLTFIIMSDFDGRLNALMSLFMWQAIFLPMNAADKKHNGVLPRPVSLIFDEFKNVGKLPSFEQCIAVVRSRNIDCTIILQNLSQLKELYGEDGMATIRGNCPTTVYLGGGRDFTTAKQIAEETGKETITVTSTSQQGNILFGQGTVSKQLTARDVYDAGEVALLPSTDALVLFGDKQPIQDKKSWCFEHARYSKEYQGRPPAERVFDYKAWKEAGRPRGAAATIWRREQEAADDVRKAYAAIGEAEERLVTAELGLATQLDASDGGRVTLRKRFSLWKASTRVDMAREGLAEAKEAHAAALAAKEEVSKECAEAREKLREREHERIMLERKIRKEVMDDGSLRS